MITLRLVHLCLWLIAVAVRAEPVETTPKLENLNKQIMANAENAQAYANRGYALALLGRTSRSR